jgi:hypothetical protein
VAGASNAAAMISKRTKDALKAAKARGVVLGRPQLAIDQKNAAVASAEALRPILTELADLSMSVIAAELTKRKIKIARGGAWTAMQCFGCRIVWDCVNNLRTLAKELHQFFAAPVTRVVFRHRHHAFLCRFSVKSVGERHDRRQRGQALFILRHSQQIARDRSQHSLIIAGRSDLAPQCVTERLLSTPSNRITGLSF